MFLFYIYGFFVNILVLLLVGVSVFCMLGLYVIEKGVSDFFEWLKLDEGSDRKKVIWYFVVLIMY